MKKRYHWIDNLRSFALINMILYHAIWDLCYLYEINLAWFDGKLAFLWQQSICWIFILLSGFCWSFSKNPLKQGALVSFCGILVSMITVLFSYESRILYGVLTLIGASALLMIPMEKIFRKISAKTGVLLSFLTFCITYPINEGWIGFLGWKGIMLPKRLYHGELSNFLGFSDPTFFSTDYFSIVPWLFLYITGYFIYRLWERDEARPKFGWINQKVPVLTLMGKHSLPIYLLHQPVIYVGLWFVFHVLY